MDNTKIALIIVASLLLISIIFMVTTKCKSTSSLLPSIQNPFISSNPMECFDYNTSLISINSSTIDFFGDSIMFGYRVTPETRWSNLLSVSLGKTENNFAVPGDTWQEALSQVYGNTVANTKSGGHIAGNVSVFGLGVNDIRQMNNGGNYPDDVLRIAESLILFCCLPSSNITNPRNTTTRTGTWINTPAYTTWGISSKNVGDTLTVKTTGRFIAFSSTILDTNTITNHGTLSIAIDGTLVQTNIPQVMKLTPTAMGTAWCSSLWTYDTGKEGDHTIIIAIGAHVGSFNDYQFVDWVGGFSVGQNGAIPVILTAVQMIDPAGFDIIKATGGGGGASGTDQTRELLNEGYSKLAKKYQALNLPIYFIEESGSYSHGQLNDDLIHPNQFGHNYIFNKVKAKIS